MTAVCGSIWKPWGWATSPPQHYATGCSYKAKALAVDRSERIIVDTHYDKNRPRVVNV